MIDYIYEGPGVLKKKVVAEEIRDVQTLKNKYIAVNLLSFHLPLKIHCYSLADGGIDINIRNLVAARMELSSGSFMSKIGPG